MLDISRIIRVVKTKALISYMQLHRDLYRIVSFFFFFFFFFFLGGGGDRYVYIDYIHIPIPLKPESDDTGPYVHSLHS